MTQENKPWLRAILANDPKANEKIKRAGHQSWILGLLGIGVWNDESEKKVNEYEEEEKRNKQSDY